MTRQCRYCLDEGLDPEPAVMCEGHFNSTMAIAQMQIDALQKKIDEHRKAIRNQKKKA